jgi:hypothetical protein
MLRCGLEETPEAKMARFFGGLNREIQTLIIKNIILSLVYFTLLVKLKEKCRTGKGQGALLGLFLQVGQIKGKQRRPQLPPAAHLHQASPTTVCSLLPLLHLHMHLRQARAQHQPLLQVPRQLIQQEDHKIHNAIAVRAVDT